MHYNSEEVWEVLSFLNPFSFDQSISIEWFSQQIFCQLISEIEFQLPCLPIQKKSGMLSTSIHEKCHFYLVWHAMRIQSNSVKCPVLLTSLSCHTYVLCAWSVTEYIFLISPAFTRITILYAEWVKYQTLLLLEVGITSRLIATGPGCITPLPCDLPVATLFSETNLRIILHLWVSSSS